MNCVTNADLDDNIDSNTLQPQLDNMNAGGIWGLTRTTSSDIPDNAHLYHSSRGDRRRGQSATIFFAVYAVDSAYNPGTQDIYCRKVTFLGQEDLRVKYDDPAPLRATAFQNMRVGRVAITRFPLLPPDMPVTVERAVQQANLKLIIVLAGLGYHNGGRPGRPRYSVPIRDNFYITNNNVELR